MWYWTRCYGNEKFSYEKCNGCGYICHHAFEAFRTLKATGEGKSPFKIKDETKLKWMCEKVGIDQNQDINKLQ